MFVSSAYARIVGKPVNTTSTISAGIQTNINRFIPWPPCLHMQIGRLRAPSLYRKADGYDAQPVSCNTRA
jgi:hypothetical protein